MQSLHHATRDLDVGLCSALRSFNTTYNGEKDVPPYVGYMFEISAMSDVEILTFELDIRFDLNPTDLSIEVYTFDGAYDIVMDKPEAWDQIAGTYLVATSSESGSALIPASDFSPVQIAAGEKRSFYVTMKYPYLDHTVYGLQHRGDIHIAGDDLQLLVGSGFHSYKFPGAVDPILNPQFAGVVHYRKSFACDDAAASTTMVDFPFLFEVSVLREALVSKANAAVDLALSNLLASNGKLRSMVNEFGVQKSSPAASYLVSQTSICPDDWMECPSSYLNVRVVFHHRDALDSGLLRYEMYKITSPITDAALKAPDSGVRGLYVGYVSTEARYTLRLQGAPSTPMNEMQMKYFEETTELFLQSIPAGTLVFRLQVDKQSLSDSEGEGRRRLDGGITLVLEGIVKGAYLAGRTANDFSISVGKLFESKETTYMSLLKNGEVRPGYIRNSLSYFQNISTVSSLIEFPAKATAAGPKKATVASGVFGSLGGLLLLVGFYLLLRHRKNEKIRSIELEEYRKEMRERRRVTRLEKSDRNRQHMPSSDFMNGDVSKASLRSFDINTRMRVECATGMDGQVFRTRSKSEAFAESLHALGQAGVPLLSSGEIPRVEMIALEGIPMLSPRQLISEVSSPNLGRSSDIVAEKGDSTGPLRASFPLSPRSPTSRREVQSSGQSCSPSSRTAAARPHRSPANGSTSPNIVTRHLVTAGSSPCLGVSENSASNARARLGSRASLPTLPSPDHSQRPFAVGSIGTMSPTMSSLRLGTSRSPKATVGRNVSCSSIFPGNDRLIARPHRASFTNKSPQLVSDQPIMSPESASHRQSSESQQTCFNPTSGTAGSLSPISPVQRFMTAASSSTGSPITGPKTTCKRIGQTSPLSPSDHRRVSRPLRASFPMSPQLDIGQTKAQSPISSKHVRMTATAINSSSRSLTASDENASPWNRRKSQMNVVDGVLSPNVRRLVTSTSWPNIKTGARETSRNIEVQRLISPTDRPRTSRPHPATFPVSPPLDTCKLSPHKSSPCPVRTYDTCGITASSGSHAPFKLPSPLRTGEMSPCAPARRMVTAASSPCLGAKQKMSHVQSPVSQTNQRPFRASLPASVPLVSGSGSLSPESRRRMNITGFHTTGRGESLRRPQTINRPQPINQTRPPQGLYEI